MRRAPLLLLIFLVACQPPPTAHISRKALVARGAKATPSPRPTASSTAEPEATPTPTPGPSDAPEAEATASPTAEVGLVSGAQPTDSWAIAPSLRRARFGAGAVAVGDDLLVVEGESRPSVEVLAPGANVWALANAYDRAAADMPDSGLAGGMRLSVVASDGRVAYVAAGASGDFGSNAVFKYDETGPVETLGGLDTEVSAAAGGLSESTLVLAGGRHANGEVVPAVQRFLLGLGTVTRGADMPTPVAGAAGAVVAGKLYVFGGYTLDAQDQAVATALVQVYDVEGNTWTTSDQTGGPAPMATARHSAAAAVLDGKIIVAGGVGTGGAVTGTVAAYDPAAKTWKTLAPLPTPRALLALAAASGRVWAVGGMGAEKRPLTTVEVYRP